MLYWPSFFFFSGNIPKQSSLLFLLFFLGLKIRKSAIKRIDLGLLILIILAIYYLIINTLNFTSIIDYIDVLKCFGLIIVYLVAKSTTLLDISNISKNYGIFLYILIFTFFLGDPYNLASYFYSDFGKRFFGTSNSPNYFWINIASISILLGGVTIHDRKTYFVFIVSLLLTGSRTTYLLMFIWLLAFLLMDGKRLVLRISALGVLILIIPWTEILPVYYFKRIVDLYNAVISFDLTRLHSFAVRLEIWKDAIEKFSWFGSGSRKTMMHIYDNSYFTSIIRYGYIGMTIELIFYIFLFYKSFISKRINRSILTVFFLSYLIAGISSSVFYNLRLPYMFVFTLVLLSSRHVNIYNSSN